MSTREPEGKDSVVQSPGATWDLGMLPFQIGHRSKPSNAPSPDWLPFVVGVDEQTGLVVQCPNQETSRSLADAYRMGSQMGTPFRDEGVGRPQLDDFLAFIEDSLPASALSGLDVLEIGCGDGALLARLLAAGAKVVGVEPGESAARFARERGLEIHAEPFDPGRFGAERFDLIVHHTVLEHVERPVAFLAAQCGLLRDRGRIVCGVPDCGAALSHGDLSMLVHEHWSYFDAHTLAHVAELAGARVVTTREATSEGAIYCAFERADTPTPTRPDPMPYIARAQQTLDTLAELVARAARAGSVGVYCGGRFVNYFALATRPLGDPPAMRWFDDDPALHGRFYPPVPIPIEDRDQLVAHPVDRLLIASWTFGSQLRDQLASEDALAHTQISTFADVL
jgi:2-polyprenyl-3-methyl-5-hydroxy-6-metoxy-1,4-benzoquinol methylase